ncbi:PREDICTED: DAN domain family member 5 [Chinchilla lanigera]|uniref:DAN domain BMP antagonist family member 5 n=1 Tax=Chinchilla lanigera TaxID=34839 RepID=A0A8C2VJL6_CHILA|nr:PREDICTED: DAN domain family member 5 [Chinchilla lanigera]
MARGLLRGLLTAVLGLLIGAWLPTGLGQPRSQVPLTQPWAATSRPRALVPLTPPTASALGSWKTFLGLQGGRRQGPGGPRRGQGVAGSLSLPLDPQEVTQERCRAVPFVQVLSRPSCTTVRIHNHLCFGQCSSLYVPGSAAASSSLCNSCVPARKRRVPVVLWCAVGGPASPRRVKTSTVLVEGCRCSPKL